MNAVTRMSSKGQVVIPKDVRDALGWAEGQELSVRKSGDRAVLELATRKREKINWEEFRRRVPKIYNGPAISVEEMDDAVAEMWRKRAQSKEW
jgi:AbrB family looped-hinge helix DNA binding protein